MRHYLYLHGFASSPASGKARFLADRLGACGATLHCPDLNAPDFATLTITRMIDRAAEAIATLPPAPVVVVGSSLGAFVALHLAASGRVAASHPLERMVWLAPALQFGRGDSWLDDRARRRWRETGWLEVMHHGYGELRRVRVGLLEDAARFDSFAVPWRIPTLIVQGRRDDVIDPETVRRFAEARPSVRLVLVDDGHQLGESLTTVWDEVRAFTDADRSR